MGERIAWWIRTPQVPSSRPSWYGTFNRASEWLPPYQHHRVEHSLVCVEGRGKISLKWVAVDFIRMGSCVFQCDVPHSTATGRPCICILWWDGVSCPVSGMAFMCGSTLVKVPLLQAGTITIWPQMFKSNVNQNKQNYCFKNYRPPIISMHLYSETFCKALWLV